jgi:hypothetical protein
LGPRRFRLPAWPTAVVLGLAILATACSWDVTAAVPARATSRPSAVEHRQRASDRLSTTHWTTVFADSFSGAAGSPLGPSWKFFSGAGIGIGQYLDSSSVVHLDGHGHLVITAMKTPQGWESGEIETTDGYMPGPGQEMLVESNVMLPAGGQGYWPAFWALGVPALTNPSSEPMAGEDDIAETINNDNWIGQYMHCGASNRSGPCGADTQVEYHLSLPAGDSGWHRVSWLWCNKGPNSYVAFYIGNTLDMKITEQQIGEKYWALSFDHPYIFIYDLAVGGWPGLPDQSTAPSASMMVDYIRIAIS